MAHDRGRASRRQLVAGEEDAFHCSVPLSQWREDGGVEGVRALTKHSSWTLVRQTERARVFVVLLSLYFHQVRMSPVQNAPRPPSDRPNELVVLHCSDNLGKKLSLRIREATARRRSHFVFVQLHMATNDLGGGFCLLRDWAINVIIIHIISPFSACKCATFYGFVVQPFLIQPLSNSILHSSTWPWRGAALA